MGRERRLRTWWVLDLIQCPVCGPRCARPRGGCQECGDERTSGLLGVSGPRKSLCEALCVTVLYVSTALGARVQAPAWIQASSPHSWLTLNESLGLTPSVSPVGLVPVPTSWGCCEGLVSKAVKPLQRKPGCQQPALCLTSRVTLSRLRNCQTPFSLLCPLGR